MKIAFQFVQFFHHAMIDELCVGQIDYDVLPLRQAHVFDLPSKRNSVAEDRRLMDSDDDRVFITFGDVQIRLEQ